MDTCTLDMLKACISISKEPSIVWVSMHWIRFIERRKGETILRFDDTNPTTEKLEFIENILEDVHWLGWDPVKITFGSDYFDQLYEYALQLIKKGKAYVDHQVLIGNRMKHRRQKKSNNRGKSQWR